MLETEIKFFLPDLDMFRRRLQASKAISEGVVFETNYRFDNAQNQLRAERCLLRLRRDRHNILTFKRPHPAGGRQFKTHEELEIKVSDFATTCQMLEAIGFHCAQIYEKRRETFVMDDVEICLDQLPYGDFAEIEGAPDTIPSMAAHLGLDWRHRILANYLQIFEALRKSLHLTFNDVTFAHFKTVSGDWRSIIRQFEAGATR
jgi:adenylate cyclase class 2